MPEVANWATEKAVREMARTGDIHQRQVIAEIERRQDVLAGNQRTPRFVDSDPWKGVEGGILVPFGMYVSPDGEITDAPAGDDGEE